MIAGLKKELTLFIRDKKSVLLFLLTPFAIMVLLSVIFGPQGSYFESMKIGLCNHDPTVLFPFPAKIVVPQGCDYILEPLVKKGELHAGVIIPPRFSDDIKDGKGTRITLVLDNTKEQISVSIANAFEAYVNQINEKVGVEFIDAAWVQLRDLNKKLKIAYENLKILDENLQKATDQIQQLSLSVYKTPNPMRIDIQEINITLLNLNSEINTLIEMNLDRQVEDISSSISSIESVLLSFPTPQIIQQNFTAVCTNCADACPPVEVCNRIVESINVALRIDQARSSLSSLKSKLEVIRTASAQINSKIINIRNIADIQKSQDMISSLREEQRLLAESRAMIIEAVENVSLSLLELSDSVTNVKDDLAKTTDALDEYTSKDPRNIVRAVSLNKSQAFSGRSRFINAAPGLMIIVLMLITLLGSSSNVVRELTGGSLKRMVLSPQKVSLSLLEKILFLFMLCILQIFAMSVAIWLNGSLVGWSLDAILGFSLVSIVFILLGLVIGLISKKESTAVPFSLAVALPLMFLSGVFIPIELMPSVLSDVASYSPATIGVGIARQSMIYNLGLNTVDVSYLVVSALVLFLWAVLLMKMRSSEE